jgi:hypothetical protein
VKGDGVSEVIGAIILISVAVLAIGIVILALFAGPLPTGVPAFSGLISISANTVYISHEGGDTLYPGQFKILVDGRDETYNFTKSLNGPFSVGKVMNATLPAMPGRVVMVFNTSWGGGTVLLSADLNFWYSGNWLNREKITINKTMVSGSLTDFPVLISIGDPVGLKKHAQSDGDDILFTSWDGTTKLAHEIEFYDGNAGNLVAWVKVPLVTSASDTIIYMYYNNSAASSQQDKTAVWANGYQGVWHLIEATGATRYDSTGNHNDLKSINGVAQCTGTWIGKCADFTRTSSQNLSISDSAQTGLDISGPITLEAWVKPHETANTPYYLIDKDEGSCSGGQPPYYLRLSSGNSSSYVRENILLNSVCNANPSDLNGDTNNAISVNTWNLLAGVYDGSYLRLYKNGAQTNSTAYNSGIFNSDGQFIIGGRLTTQYFDGLIDEVRVSSTARSPEWIQTEYNNENSPTTFLSLGTEQTQSTMS